MSPSVRIGRTRTGRDICLAPFVSQHTVLTGATRSGKSVCLYTMLSQLPGLPVQVCGVDPSGILFNALGDALGGQSRRVATLRNPVRVEQVLNGIVHEMDDRIDTLLGLRLDKFDSGDFTEDVPLLIVLLEEFPGMLAAIAADDMANGRKQSERLEPRIRAHVQRLALEGAKVGIRLWIVAQRADAAILTGVLRSQLSQRISFRQDADGLRMLHESITPEQIDAAQRFLPGQGFVEFAGTVPLTPFRSDFITYRELVDRFHTTDAARKP